MDLGMWLSVGELERSCSDSQKFAELFVAEFPAILAERSGRNVAESESADVAEFPGRGL